MDLLIVEVLLWIGFGLILWAMRESLLQLESEVQAHAGRSSPDRPVRHQAVQPQRLIAPIGHYRGDVIHEYALIDGRHYRFACICPSEAAGRLAGNERWLAPGLVYSECRPPLPHTDGPGQG